MLGSEGARGAAGWRERAEGGDGVRLHFLTLDTLLIRNTCPGREYILLLLPPLLSSLFAFLVIVLY